MLKNGEDPGLFNKMYTRYNYAHDVLSNDPTVLELNFFLLLLEMLCNLLHVQCTCTWITRNVIQRTSCTMYMYMDY